MLLFESAVWQKKCCLMKCTLGMWIYIRIDHLSSPSNHLFGALLSPGTSILPSGDLERKPSAVVIVVCPPRTTCVCFYPILEIPLTGSNSSLFRHQELKKQTPTAGRNEFTLTDHQQLITQQVQMLVQSPLGGIHIFRELE